MSRQNKLLQSPPYPVEQTMRQLGADLRVARIRRNMTIADAAERIGTGPRAVMDAEKGKGATGSLFMLRCFGFTDRLISWAKSLIRQEIRRVCRLSR